MPRAHRHFLPNQICLLVKDTNENTIAKAMQLIASQTAQAYNKRKNRKGAFWEDRYHATAIDNEQYLIQCLVYIDMNMVRAGIVQHPGNWSHGGYMEIQSPPIRYSIIDLKTLMQLTDMSTLAQLQRAHRDWINTILLNEPGLREACWSESIAVGSQQFVESVQAELGYRAQGRRYFKDEDKFYLKEPNVSYGVDFDA
jgi:putative transposase